MAARVHSSEARVRQFMTENPITASPEMDCEEAEQMMLDKGFRHLPVMEGEDVVGVVSLRRVVAATKAAAAPRSVRLEFSATNALARKRDERLRRPRRRPAGAPHERDLAARVHALRRAPRRSCRPRARTPPPPAR